MNISYTASTHKQSGLCYVAALGCISWSIFIDNRTQFHWYVTIFALLCDTVQRLANLGPVALEATLAPGFWVCLGWTSRASDADFSTEIIY